MYADRELLAQLREQDSQPVATARGDLLRRFTEDCKAFSFCLLLAAADIYSCLSRISGHRPVLQLAGHIVPIESIVAIFQTKSASGRCDTRFLGVSVCASSA